MDSLKVLVIFLSTTLGVLLICSIILIIKCIQLVNFVKGVTERANAVMEDVEAVGEFFRRSTGPMAVGNMIGSLIDNFKHATKGKGKK